MLMHAVHFGFTRLLIKSHLTMIYDLLCHKQGIHCHPVGPKHGRTKNEFPNGYHRRDRWTISLRKSKHHYNKNLTLSPRGHFCHVDDLARSNHILAMSECNPSSC
jgi:hypothetical protein